MYYLTSRYYDLYIGRFISIDAIEYLDIEIVNGFNLYVYCGNNPVMYSDPEGKWSWKNFFQNLLDLVKYSSPIGYLISATIKDVYQLTSDDENGISVKVTEGNVQIINSYKIVTPWVRYGYCIFLNYFNEDTKDIIKGSSIGMEFEWFCHNIAYYITCKDRYKDVDIGATIFNDFDIRKNSDSTMDKVYSIGMILLYFMTNPVSGLYDYTKYKGDKAWLFITRNCCF